MMYLRFVAYALADIVFNLIGVLLVNWWVPVFAGKDGNLPRCLRWFQTHDANLDGLEPSGRLEPRFVTATLRYRDAVTLEAKNALCRHIIRSLWLYRNNVYGFSHYVLGVSGPFTLVRREHELYAPVVDAERGVTSRYPAQGGRTFEIFEANGKRYFRFKYLKSRGNGKCYEAFVGWKISPTRERAMLVCRWTPFRTFEATPR